MQSTESHTARRTISTRWKSAAFARSLSWSGWAMMGAGPGTSVITDLARVRQTVPPALLRVLCVQQMLGRRAVHGRSTERSALCQLFPRVGLDIFVCANIYVQLQKIRATLFRVRQADHARRGQGGIVPSGGHGQFLPCRMLQMRGLWPEVVVENRRTRVLSVRQNIAVQGVASTCVHMGAHPKRLYLSQLNVIRARSAVGEMWDIHAAMVVGLVLTAARPPSAHVRPSIPCRFGADTRARGQIYTALATLALHVLPRARVSAPNRQGIDGRTCALGGRAAIKGSTRFLIIHTIHVVSVAPTDAQHIFEGIIGDGVQRGYGPQIKEGTPLSRTSRRNSIACTILGTPKRIKHTPALMIESTAHQINVLQKYFIVIFVDVFRLQFFWGKWAIL
ncbi:unnamed protein product [Sphagnum balticum]